jgi:tRNA threonylcarbamoyladenosine biosynthesis protein TsaE
MTVTESRLADAAATAAWGARLAACCEAGLLVFLHGELGAGKTTLVRVKSPTYTLVESYPATVPPVHHLDLYRLADPEELEWLGIRDLLAGDAVCLIEWPERGQGILPAPDLSLSLSYDGAGRRIRQENLTDRGRRVQACMQDRPAGG